MSTRTVEQLSDWATVPFDGGYAGLHALADEDFSGVVTAGPTRLFMLRGTVVGVLDGAIGDFEDADATAREAPHQALPLLAVMQERSDEVRAKYYTEDTPLSDVDSTLADGNFTGYVELAENVLSGDYYQVYHQGRSMSVAWVGAAGRLITDDEAFEQANDEVGIYEVRPVDIDVVEIPEPADDDPTGAAVGGAAGGVDAAETADADAEPDGAESTDAAPAETRETEATGDDEADAGAAESGATDTHAEDQRAADMQVRDEPTAAEASEGAGSAQADSDATDEGESADPSTDGTGAEPDRPPKSSERAAGDAETAGETRSADAERRDEREADARESSGRASESASEGTAERRESAPTGATAPSDPDRTGESGGTTAGRDRGGQSAGGQDPRTINDHPPRSPESGGRGTASAGAASSVADLEMRSIPSLDPSQTEAASKAATASTPDTSRDAGGRSRSESDQRQPRSDETHASRRPRPESKADADVAEQPSTTDRPESEQGEAAADAAAETTAEATPSTSADADPEELADLRERVEELESELASVEDERDEAQSQAEQLRERETELERELEEARAEIERLESQIEELADESAVAAETRLSAAEAIDGTNLFVRYDTKGEATLESAHDGDADRSTVDANLRLEYHTQFDADGAAVGDRPFEDFLTGSIQYRFVDWLVRHLLFEIRDTGHVDGMRDLYDALPRSDRAELNGKVTVEYTEGGETHRSQERFDVVVRDRMGSPLVVATINDSRDPATEAMMTDLVKKAERLGESNDSLKGAFLVTESFFEPEALETADEATSSGLLSRDKRKSFVNLSRKDGYHLCLVEARNREFHLAVPEL